MADLFTFANQYRQRLLAREAQASAQMVRLYSASAQRIEQRVLQLAIQFEEAVARGERVSPSWIYQQERLQMLLTQVQNEIHRFAADAGPLVENVQREFALAGFSDAQDLIVLTRDNMRRVANQGVASPAADIASVGVSFARLPAEATLALVGFAADGSPLADLLGELGPDAAARVKQELFAGLVQGLGARRLAAQIKPALGGNLARAMLIGRTEALRAYRESSQRFYEDNDDVVQGWRWIAACNSRTCAVCWAMHGSMHTVAEQFVSHPGCRCTPVPVTIDTPGMATGGARFATLSEDDQRQVLGPKKFEAYQNGKISLRSLAGMKDSGRWGKTRHERKLSDAIEATRHDLPIEPGPMRKRPGDTTPAPTPAEPLELLLPIVDKQHPATSGVEARQRIIDVSKQYAGMLAAVDDEIKHIRAVKNWQFNAPAEGMQRMGELLKLRAHVMNARSERTTDILSVEQPAQFAVSIKSRVDKDRRATWEKGVDLFKRMVGIDLSTKTVTIKARGRGRANYHNSTVNLAPHNDHTVVVHELGHWLEDMSAEVHRKVVDFLERRTVGEPARSLRSMTGLNFARNETAWRDKFMEPYVGKVYRKNFVAAGEDKYSALYASEVVSMGLQWYIEKPAEFAERDPDFFDFIFDLVRGR